MSNGKSLKTKYQLHACLPFIELGVPEGLAMGPVLFWPADRASDYVDDEHLSLLGDYLSSITQVKAWSPASYIDTVRLAPASLTCVSIDDQVAPNLRDGLLIDAIYLLFFCGAFSHLFAAAKAPSFNGFTKILPASLAFLHNPDNWKEIHILETQRENTVKLERFDGEMCDALGHALACGYYTDACRSTADTAKIQCLIRAIRYFVDRFFERFENLIGKGLQIPRLADEAEDIVFLATSFEALFNLSDEHPHIDFKHKLRPMLGLRYSQAVELLWAWVDGFYHLREEIVHGHPVSDPWFRANPNYEISYFYLGIKLFLYGVYWRLHFLQLIPSKGDQQPGMPLEFKWVTPEEILPFFWTEENLIQRIHRLLQELAKDDQHPALRQDLALLSRLFLYAAQHIYAERETPSAIRWKPCPLEKVGEPLRQILNLLEQMPRYDNPVFALLPLGFVEAVQLRLNHA